MHEFVNANAERLPFADKVFDLTFTSPPYIDARTYGIEAQRDCVEWIDWMLVVVNELVRVTKGLVLVNCAGVTRDWNYQPGPEGLLYEWWKRGGRCWRPAYWHRVGIPGSGGTQWLRADIEYVLAFTGCEGKIPWADNTANGNVPVYAPGGPMSYRNTDGARKNEKTEKVKRRRISCGHDKDGNTRQADVYVPPDLSNPGVLVEPEMTDEEVLSLWMAQADELPGVIKGIKVGGGLMGNPICHKNEAPFPIKLAQWFIRSFCPQVCCSKCGSVIQCDYDKTTMRALWKEDKTKPEQNEILLSGMRESKSSKKKRKMQTLQEADSLEEVQPECGILRKEMFVQVDSNTQIDLQRLFGNDDGIYIKTSTGASECEQVRLRDGTSLGDGEEDRKISGKRRSSSPQKREKSGQSNIESGTINEEGTRLFAEAKTTDSLSEVRSHGSTKPLCVGCGSDLTIPNSIRPGRVLDPFSGSGTVVDAAVTLGRSAVGCDLRFSQCELGRQRLGSAQPELFS